METVQRGFRGTGMELVQNPETLEEVVAANIAPEPLPTVPDTGPKASDVYQNVQVLGDLSVGEFTRLMASITQWVSPEQGCNYCHNEEGFAHDKIYTKRVARVMIAMTQRTNEAWQPHVGDTGVTCYTCHRGKNIPDYVWAQDPGPARARGSVMQADQNYATAAVGLTSLPYDPFTSLLYGDNMIGGIIGDTALPVGHDRAIQDTEKTYALMMHFSDSLGVNCTHCHNSRAFNSWEQASPQKVTAWHGIRMVREINKAFIEPTTAWLPEHRKGPLGDALKTNCQTCHQGAYKPLLGAQMLKSYPNLATLGSKARERYLPGGK
jgi:photosynthetic reaction center cytochrome c subunit